MDKEYYIVLAKVRMDRARELLAEAKALLDNESYKSSNNRAFYAIEKSVKALLATEAIEAATHNGCLKQFNYHFIFKGNGTFTADDYQKIAKAGQIRNASDYDDFYLANKEETAGYGAVTQENFREFSPQGNCRKFSYVTLHMAVFSFDLINRLPAHPRALPRAASR